MTDNSALQEQLWEKGWDGHEQAQLRRMARLSFKEKIEWLEEAQEILLNASKTEKSIEKIDIRNQ